MALVITLIMLSVVTITAVAFLMVARRERAAVAAAGEQADVRIAADAALNRARARILAQIASSGMRESPTLFVSTNFIAPFYTRGFTAAGQGCRWVPLSPINGTRHWPMFLTCTKAARST